MTTIQHFERALGRKALWADRRVRKDERRVREAVRAPAAHLPARAPRPQRVLPPVEEGAALRLLPGRARRTTTTHRGRSSSPACRTTSSPTRRRTRCSTACTRASTSRRTATSTPSTRRSPTSWRCSSTSRIRPSSRARSAERAAISHSESLLGQLAQQFGRATGRGAALRDALGGVDEETGTWKPRTPDPHALDSTLGAHDRGAILVAAVFRAFLLIYRARTADLFRIATQGTGTLPEGEIHPDLTARLAQEAARCADRVLQMCIRAIDYCPPVDITFGDFLRGVITADLDFSPEDRESFRIVFIESFREWGIYPRGISSMGVDALAWPTGEELIEGADAPTARSSTCPSELRGTSASSCDKRRASGISRATASTCGRTSIGLREASCGLAARGRQLRSRLRAHLRARDRSERRRRRPCRGRQDGPAVEVHAVRPAIRRTASGMPRPTW